MNEAIARVADGRLIELIDDQKNALPVPLMTPVDAAFLGRGILATCTVLASPTPVASGQVIADAHLPIMKWNVGRENRAGFPVMILTLPTGIALTFEMPPETARDLGTALIAQGTTNQPLGPQGEKVH